MISTRQGCLTSAAVLLMALAASAPAAAQSALAPGAVSEPLPQEAQAVVQNYGMFDKSAPVGLTADTLQHDEVSQTVTASGHVELTQGQRILKADEVTYNLGTDTVAAKGNVILVEPNGDVHFADEVHLSQKMSAGSVKGLQSYLGAGGRFEAAEGQRATDKVTMKDASYTPCECEADERGHPAWQIKAREVTYDEAEHRVSYKKARFELFGIPLFWTPFLSHPDGQIKRKSGFLSPDAGFDSELGGFITSKYYWALAPDHDMTLGVMTPTRVNPVALAEYRQRFGQAELTLDGSTTYSPRTDSVAGRDVRLDDEWRGHLFADGLWNIDDKWRAGLNLNLTSDDQYLRQYNFSNEDVLENEVYAERFSGRDYAVARLLGFQDVRVREERTDQPDVLPEVIASFVGEPNAMLGGRWNLDMSLLGLQRDGTGQDMDRIVTEAGWEKKYITDFGLVSTIQALARGDAYYVNDRDIATAGSGRSNDATKTRFFPSVTGTTSLPMVKPLEKAQAVIEPIVSVTASPHIDSVDDDIPDEDSQDVQVDASNVFDPNRFPGQDRIEDGSHATYGMRTGLYGYDGSHADIFVGQSYRFDDDHNPFPDGSGLSRQSSDLVGQISASYEGRMALNYRFQLDSTDMSSQRHEVDGYADFGRVTLSTRYLFAKALEGTTIDESREQIQNNVAYSLTEHWRVRVGGLHDLGEDPGLRKAVMGIDYFGCCLSFSATAERNLTTDSSGDSGTEVMVRLGLKGLGEFQQGPNLNGGKRRAEPLDGVP